MVTNVTQSRKEVHGHEHTAESKGDGVLVMTVVLGNFVCDDIHSPRCVPCRDITMLTIQK